VTESEVLRIHTDLFYRALKNQAYGVLEKLYSDDYLLVRLDGSVLDKQDILQDLQTNGLAFHSIELSRAKVRVYGPTAVLTGEGRTVTWRNGVEAHAHFRFISLYSGARQAATPRATIPSAGRDQCRKAKYRDGASRNASSLPGEKPAP